MGGVEWTDRNYRNAQYCVRSEGESSLVEATIDSDRFDDRTVHSDYCGAGVGCCRWTYCRVARERLRIRPGFPHSLEDHSVAGGAWVHDAGVCVDLLLRA